jgi:hypothetical protein
MIEFILITLTILNFNIVTRTNYSPSVDETDDDPYQAKCGPVHDCSIALDRRLIRKVGCHKKVLLLSLDLDTKCWFVFSANDTMAERKEDWADVFHWEKEGAMEAGIGKAVLINLN